MGGGVARSLEGSRNPATRPLRRSDRRPRRSPPGHPPPRARPFRDERRHRRQGFPLKAKSHREAAKIAKIWFVGARASSEMAPPPKTQTNLRALRGSAVEVAVAS